jgi:hypothetical protein
VEEFTVISEPTKAVIIEPKAAYQDWVVSVDSSKVLNRK